MTVNTANVLGPTVDELEILSLRAEIKRCVWQWFALDNEAAAYNVCVCV